MSSATYYRAYRLKNAARLNARRRELAAELRVSRRPRGETSPYTLDAKVRATPTQVSRAMRRWSRASLSGAQA